MMSNLNNTELIRCPTNGNCAEWALKYMNYCLCSSTDWASMTLGLVSVVTWTVAEIPQIITNYRQKSTEGLSVAFLATWIIGDIFNVVGCYMEPATLPTQYYTAVLYTMITMVLVAQAMYYDYLYPKLNHSQLHEPEVHADQSEVDDKTKQISCDVDEEQDYYTDISSKDDAIASTDFLNEPINVPLKEDLYYMSARSLTKSRTPPLGSFLAQTMSSPTSRQARNALLEPFLAEHVETEPEPTTRVKTLLSVVPATTFIVGAINLYTSFSGRPNPGFVIPVGRKLLQENGGLLQEPGIGESFGAASLLGWGMAAIYLGGRIPQIFLNMRKGSVEGLNPLMFVFALLGNATYVASILVNSMEWTKLRPNLPWLVDSGGCVLLDGFILLQFLYLHYRKPKKAEESKERTYVV